MDRIVNLRLLSHPVNWLIVWTVLAIAGFAAMQVHKGLAGGGCGCRGTPANPD